jgi:hypothetical protein
MIEDNGYIKVDVYGVIEDVYGGVWRTAMVRNKDIYGLKWSFMGYIRDVYGVACGYVKKLFINNLMKIIFCEHIKLKRTFMV